MTRPNLHRLLALAVVLLAIAPAARAQDPVVSDTSAGQSDRLRAFIDCQAPYCDFDFIRTEITYVDYVRDRRDAPLHVLITAQMTGGGGWEFTLGFIGQGTLTGADQTLRYVSSGTDVSAEIRSGLTHTLRLGLMRYVAGRPEASRISVSVTPAAAAERPTPARDPWNLWTFRISGSGRFGGERANSSAGTSGSFSASRTTELWKISFTGSGSYSESAFEVPEEDGSTRTITNYQHSSNNNALVVRSLGGRWASGVQLTARASTRENQRLTLRLAPAIEANLFPYSESTRRQLTARYTVGVSAYDYRDTTIYFKSDEMIGDHSLQIGYSATQPWGSVYFSLLGSQAFHDASVFRVTGGGFGNFRLFRGFDLRVGGSYARINDQIYLPKSEETVEDVLLRRRQLATRYQFGVDVGLSYRFGSVFQNVVNSRFQESFFFFF
ncbi:MAG TPA: hypothetical protein VMM18_15010 [Gemmatimonadaceae bacterium]|nr:hypothetical protein [Gemmatimonadaceae bacterium]